MKTYVIDAGVLSLYFAGDKRVEKYFYEIDEGKAKGLLCDVNLAEYYYKTCEKLGKEIAEIRFYQIRGSAIKVVPTTEELVKKAGEKKCKHRKKLSLADCFVLALAELEHAIILTTDPELEKLKDIKVKFFPV